MVEVVGHRGAAAYEPENTLRSFETAIRLGVNTIELDIHLTKDRRLVVMHDSTVDRTTNGKGEIKEMYLHELRRLDAGKGEKIPTLEEVIKLAKGRVALQIELKGRGTAIPAAELISKYNADNTYLISFISIMITNVKKNFPNILTGMLLQHTPKDPLIVLKSTGADMLSINHSEIDEQTIEKVQREKKQICAWTANEPAEIRRLISLGVDAIVSDKPDLVIKNLHRDIARSK